MKISGIKKYLPSWQSAALAVLSAVLLIMAFPGFEWWFTAWIAFIPLLLAIDRERDSAPRSLFTGWIFGTCFFFGTCWWLTYSPINYAGFPVLLAYFLLLCVCLIVGIFPAFFALILSVLLRRLGTYAMLSAPFVWIATEFLRFWVTGNNWNAVAYSQSFGSAVRGYAQFGGIYLTGFMVLVCQTFAVYRFQRYSLAVRLRKEIEQSGINLSTDTGPSLFRNLLYVATLSGLVVVSTVVLVSSSSGPKPSRAHTGIHASIVAIQPNVPMSGLTPGNYQELKRKHVDLAEGAFPANLGRWLDENYSFNPVDAGMIPGGGGGVPAHFSRLFQERPKIVIFPESPMNFMYEEDKDFQEFVRAFAIKNNASVLFNAAEPDPANRKYFNSAVMVDAAGNKVAQYDKIYLVPFGETVPAPLQNIVPALVGSFSYGKEYDLLPFGDAKGGIMICFESHFPNLSREYVREGADVLIEMTNDGYLGPTPVLRQHLANAVFRAVETSRPLLRVTNVGISAYINEKGEVLEPTESYTEDTRVWSVSRSDGGQTFYVKYGDWFAWLCSIVTLILLVLALFKQRTPAENKVVDI